MSALAFLPPEASDFPAIVYVPEARRVPLQFLDGFDQMLLLVPGDVLQSQSFSLLTNLLYSHALAPLSNCSKKSNKYSVGFLIQNIR
jgi:hypothetical protein